MNFAIARVLVPVDFSPCSELAFRYATSLASRLGASVNLLHVVEDPVATGAWSSEVQIPDLPDLRKTLIRDAARRLEQYRAVAEVPGVRVVTTVRMGQTAEVIGEYAKSSGIDLIVMGTHGRGGLAHVFMGSVAERMVRHAPCPVLTIRGTAVGDKSEATLAVEPPALGAALGHLGTSRE